MKVYYGSNQSIRKLRIESDSIRRNSKYPEGAGLYFTFDKEAVKSNNKYLYTLEIDDNMFLDFTDQMVVLKYINMMLKYAGDACGVDLVRLINIKFIVKSVLQGYMAVIDIVKEVMKELDSSYQWYSQTNEESRGIAENALLSYASSNLKVYKFNNSLKESAGVAKSVEPDVIMIESKEEGQEQDEQGVSRQDKNTSLKEELDKAFFKM